MSIRISESHARTHVAITGLGTVAPGGLDVASAWASALEGRRPFAPLTRFPTDGLRTRIAATVPDSWAAKLPSSVRFRYDRHAWFALGAADEALADAGIEVGRLDPTRMGVAMGTAHGPLLALEEHWESLRDMPLDEQADAASGFLMPHASLNTASAIIAIQKGMLGPSLGVMTACGSGTSAIGEAASAIRLGRADIMVAGGAEASICRTTFAGYGRIGAMSERNDDPQGALRPFDLDRDGFVMGEGAAVLVLEDLEHARARGARIYAVLTGYGAASDSHDLTNMHPEGRGAQAALRGALADARIDRERVDLINAHGSSTPVNDFVESKAIRAVFGPHRPLVQSTKPLTGHLMGAAGAIEALLVALQIHHGVLLPTANCDRKDPACDVDVPTGAPRQQAVRVALTSSAGFGGPDATLVLEEVS